MIEAGLAKFSPDRRAQRTVAKALRVALGVMSNVRSSIRSVLHNSPSNYVTFKIPFNAIVLTF